jgi:hypothetical protein
MGPSCHRMATWCDCSKLPSDGSKLPSDGNLAGLAASCSKLPSDDSKLPSDGNFQLDPDPGRSTTSFVDRFGRVTTKSLHKLGCRDLPHPSSNREPPTPDLAISSSSSRSARSRAQSCHPMATSSLSQCSKSMFTQTVIDRAIRWQLRSRAWPPRDRSCHRMVQHVTVHVLVSLGFTLTFVLYHLVHTHHRSRPTVSRGNTHAPRGDTHAPRGDTHAPRTSTCATRGHSRSTHEHLRHAPTSTRA